jgi:selenocysteine lyase/cysteine desulfurase
MVLARENIASMDASSRHAYWLTRQTGKPLDQMREYSLRNDLGARVWDVFCTANFLNFVPWTRAIEYLLQTGAANIADYDQRLVGQIILKLDEERFELISSRTGPQRSTLIVIRPCRGEPVAAWHRRLLEAGFDVAVREGNLRISPHLHNSQEEVANLVEALSA